MASVVLEEVYKSYQARPGEAAKPATPAAVPSPTAIDSEPARGTTSVLRQINLTVADGEFMVLVGPSGCGKSTLLRLIAGLEQITAGNIWVGERLVNHLPPKQRDIAMVFQSYALYPHMNVYNNLAFGLRRTAAHLEVPASNQIPLPAPLEAFFTNLTRALPKELRYSSPRERAIDQRVRTIAQMLQIEPLLQRLPKQLSGGQKQRVALGRAMARNPQVFLMDEPLSNLDAKLRAETRAQIVKLQRQLETTTIYVTHDQTEAMTMGDRIAVMNGGQIQQLATPLELYNYPANLFVAEFIGSPPMNFLPITHEGEFLVHPHLRLPLPAAWRSPLESYRGTELILGIRAEHLHPAAAQPDHLPVRVELIEALGNETYVAAKLGATSRDDDFDTGKPTEKLLQVRLEPDLQVRLGEVLHLKLQLAKAHLFDPQTTQALPLPSLA